MDPTLELTNPSNKQLILSKPNKQSDPSQTPFLQLSSPPSVPWDQADITC